LLQLLTYAEGKHLIGIGEEMDTLVKSERAGVWSQKSDIYRLAFDNAEYGQAYMSDSSFNAHIHVGLFSLCLLARHRMPVFRAILRQLASFFFNYAK
jgi:hypothetical protein